MGTNFSELKGKVLKEIINDDDKMVFICEDGDIYQLSHY